MLLAIGCIVTHVCVVQGKKYICGYQQCFLVRLTDCSFTHYGNYLLFIFFCDEKLPELTNSLMNCSVICNVIFFLLALVL